MHRIRRNIPSRSKDVILPLFSVVLRKVKTQWEQTEIQKIALEQVAKRGCGVSILRGSQNPAQS